MDRIKMIVLVVTALSIEQLARGANLVVQKCRNCSLFLLKEANKIVEKNK